MGYFTNKKILLIGGTGTIGEGMIKELIKEDPSVIRIFSRDEYKQFILQNKFENNKNLRFLIGDVRDYDRIERAMQEIDVVFNLAAMKHVPACEYNPEEAVKTNISGMINVIKAAIENNVKSVVFTSSDKAISPTNAYGATKLLAEKLVQAANFSKGKAKTKFVSVRFGNVMGSRGSVIPFFQKQILEGKKITLTDPEMTRFMMTLTQAVKLTMLAAENSLGGETFVLKMPIIKLKDLAEVVVEETCIKYNIPIENIEIKTIGLRPGEKLYEELMTEEESGNAYDIGEMYSICPFGFDINEYEKLNCRRMENISVESYSSNSQEPITKEEVRNLLFEEALIY